MCSQRVASIFADIGLDDTKFTKGAKGVLSGLGDIKGSFGKLPGILGIATVAFGMVVDTLNKMEQAAVADAKESAKLEAVLKSTGGAAGMTVTQLNDMSDAMSRQAGIDDELIVSAQAVMLTFTQIGKEVFPEAMQSAVDMAAVLGGDLQGKVTMIGKAMNDFTGYTALKRAGVSFTESQIEQIKKFKETNDLIGYQELLLKELQTEYGGAAAAINEAGDGSENLKIATENLSEAIGKNLIPAKRAWNETMTKVIDNLTEGIQKTNDWNDILEKNNITWINGVGYIKDGERVTYEYVESIQNAERANRAWTESLEGQAEAYLNLHPEMRTTITDYSDFETAVNDVKVLMKDYTTELLFNQAAAGLDAEASIMLAEKMGLIDEETSGAMERLSYFRQLLLEGKITVEEYITLITNLDTAITGIPSEKGIRIVVRGEIEQSAYDAMAFAGQGANNPFIGLPKSNRAIGGPVTANNSYIVGESGPELFIPNISGRIIPNQQLSSAQVTPAGGISSEEALVSAMLRAGLGIDYNRMGDVIVQKLQTGTFR